MPHPLVIASVPELEFDTYLSAGDSSLRVLGAAGDVGGDAFQFDEVELDIAWGAIPIPDPLPTGRQYLARLTFSDGATGTWNLAVAGNGSGFSVFSGTIADIVPEPGSLLLLTMGAAVCLKPTRLRQTRR